MILFETTKSKYVIKGEIKIKTDCITHFTILIFA